MFEPRSVAHYIVTFCLATLISTTAQAWQGTWPNLYLGGDLQARHMHFKANYGHNLFRDDFGQGNFYIGLQLNCYAGIELGYESSTTKSRETTLAAGEIVTGVPLPELLAPATFRNTARVSGPHVDFVFFYSECPEDPLKFIGSVGIAYLQGTFIRRTVQLNGINRNTSRIFSEEQLVPRLMGGIQYKFFEQWSVRATLAWENTKPLQSASPISTTAFLCKVKPEDSVIASVGLVWNFN